MCAAVPVWYIETTEVSPRTFIHRNAGVCSRTCVCLCFRISLSIVQSCVMQFIKSVAIIRVSFVST